MKKDFEMELNKNELYQFLRRNEGCKVYWLYEAGEYSATFDCNGSSVYFYWKDKTYHRIDMSTESCKKHNSQNLLKDINRIIRVEKQIEGQWLPVWTKADGFIETDFQTFAYIGERYYTFKELEQIIEEIKSLKQVIANLKVY